MKRRAPRPIGAALTPLVEELAPATTLARVQGAWEEVAGPVVAAEAAPVSERAGTVTVACRSGVWAQELELLGPDLLERLNGAIEHPAGAPPLRGLRFTAARRASGL